MQDFSEDREEDLQGDGAPCSISWPINRPTTRYAPNTSTSHHTASTVEPDEPRTPSLLLASTVHPSNLSNQPKSLSSISLRAFLLGVILGASCISTLLFANLPRITLAALDGDVILSRPHWRATFFLTTLSLFHFLEYHTTATYNPRQANVSAFLLSQNGRAYNAAHTAALIETVVGATSFPAWQAMISNYGTISLGLMMIMVGQLVRTSAMVQAGSNFNHTVQTKRSEGHILVKDGIYRWLRHPSYFGFFWWGLGTQLVLGNVVCFLAYTTILWVFFSSRIRSKWRLEFFVT